MPKTLYLHIGLPKSGTTFLQGVLEQNRERLQARDGLCWPGKSWGAHVDAASDLLDKRPPGREDIRGSWARLVEEIREAPGRGGVISMEWLCQAEPRHLDALRDSLRDDLEARVVVTVREFGSLLPSAWQEYCQNGEITTWPDFLAAVSSESPMDTHASRIFWAEQDLARVLGRWSDGFSAEAVSVVIAPPRGSAETLWDRFAAALGLDAPAGYDTALRGANSSLGAHSAELMRLVNVAANRDNLPRDAYHRVAKALLAKEVLSERRPYEPPIGFPEGHGAFARRVAELQRRQIEASGCPVIGDLGDLGAELPDTGAAPAEDTDAILAAAVDGIVGLVRISDARLVDRRAELADRAAEIDRLTAELADARRERDEAVHGLDSFKSRPWKAAAITTTERRPWLMRLRIAYWRIANAARRLTRR